MKGKGCGQSLIASILLLAYLLSKEEGCDWGWHVQGGPLETCELKFQGQGGCHHCQTHSKSSCLPPCASVVPSASSKKSETCSSGSGRQKYDVLMKHRLFLRRQDMCGHVQGRLSLPKTAGQPARSNREIGLPLARSCLSHQPPWSQAAPPPAPTRTPIESSYYIQGSLGAIIGGRWLRGAREYKGGLDSNFERVRNRPRHSAAPEA